MVPFVDLDRQHAPLRAELEAAFKRVVGSSGFVLGAEVEGFEREFAAFCGERLDGLQAALLRVKLSHVEAWNEARRSLAGAYRDQLGGQLRMVEEGPERPSIHHVFPIRVPDRDGFAAHLAEQGVQTGVHYSPALHEQPALEGRVHTPIDISGSAAWAAEELSLPMFAEMRDDELERVAEACLSAAAPA
jgi:dTDP-4-amino-4,6-dideoxygalactose transaminase